MQPKEILVVAVGAIVLTNLSVLGTLLATDYFSRAEPAVSAAEEPVTETPAPELEPEPPPKPTRHYMSQAIYACEEKVVSSNSGKHFAYEINAAASRFSEEEQLYRIFIQTKTASEVGTPQETEDITCEVNPENMAIVGYKAMKG